MYHLSRYETYLDKKFEKTLTMLLKLKDLDSSSKEPTIANAIVAERKNTTIENI